MLQKQMRDVALEEAGPRRLADSCVYALNFVFYAGSDQVSPLGTCAGKAEAMVRLV